MLQALAGRPGSTVILDAGIAREENIQYLIKHHYSYIGAVKEAAQVDRAPIALMQGEQLVMLLMEHGIGVHRSTPDLFEIEKDFKIKKERKIWRTLIRAGLECNDNVH